MNNRITILLIEGIPYKVHLTDEILIEARADEGKLEYVTKGISF
jgi:hypothetical protein